jgi:hypothetical protein
MRIPDYEIMRDKLAEYETECAEGDTIYDIIRYGNMGGWEAMQDEEVLESFIDYFGEKKIPKTKIEIHKQQCTECGYVVCVCKPVVNGKEK